MAEPVTDAGDTFEPHRAHIYAWAFRMLGSHQDALDLVQDVFLRWLSQVRESLPENPRGWLRRVTLNQAIDVIRSRRRPGSRMSIDELPARDLSARDGAEVELRELQADVAEAMSRLTGAQRTVLQAREYDGKTFAEIADAMKVALPTVKTHYLRAIRAVRDRLSRRWKPERSE